MLIEDWWESKEVGHFAKLCMANRNFPHYETFFKYWVGAENVDDFKKRVFQDSALVDTQGYRALSKESKGHKERLEAVLKDDLFDTYSERGALKLGNDKFSVMIPNGFGDGKMQVAVVEQGRVDSMMDFFTIVEGEINIYSDDCSNKVKKSLCGTYAIYNYSGIVVLEEWIKLIP